MCRSALHMKGGDRHAAISHRQLLWFCLRGELAEDAAMQDVEGRAHLVVDICHVDYYQQLK